MSAFRRTLHLLNEDGVAGWRWAVGSVLILIAAWAFWFAFARVAVYESSQSARIEMDGAVYAIDAPIAGRVVTSALSLGRRVRAGDILIELDSQQFALEQRELMARQAGLLNEIGALEREIGVERAAAARAVSASELVLREATARWNEANAAAKLADEEANRLGQLHAGGLIGELDLIRTRTEAEKRRAAGEGLRLSVARQKADENLKQSERAARIDALQRDLASLEGEQRRVTVGIERARHEIERRRIRAQTSGVLADVSILRPGSVVAAGDRIATLTTQGTLRVIASFAPTTVGRLKPGQSGRVRLAAYPWQQYGTLPVIVERVAGELRESQIRVEFRLATLPPHIPMQHALTGTVEVEVERISPATLVLRSAGR